MKLLHYQSSENIKELCNLCFKILKKQSCLIYVNNKETANVLSEQLWKNPLFIPHGIVGEDFQDIQPLLISDFYIQRQVIINFEEVFLKHTEVKCETYILWNTTPYSRDFSSYRQEDGIWKKQFIASI